MTEAAGTKCIRLNYIKDISLIKKDVDEINVVDFSDIVRKV